MNIVIVGSGPSAAAVALAMADREDVAITILDLGVELDDERIATRATMSAQEPSQWSEDDRHHLASVPAAPAPGTLPRKQIYGSNFPFDNAGQLNGVTARDGANDLVVSGAYGGFSNTWGAQVFAYSTGTFSTWPLSRDLMEPHYRAILAHIPYSGECDDLDEVFPLFGDPTHLPTVAERTRWVLARYERHRLGARRNGVTVGHARLALNAAPCRLCGLCMTGCPYELIYSASQSIDELRRRGRVTYVSGVRVHRVAETSRGSVTVSAHATRDGSPLSFTADRVFLGAGAMGTTRIVANSLGLTNTTIDMVESAQFMMPFFSLRGTTSLRQEGEFTLNQFNILVARDNEAKDAAFVHCYPYNDIMLSSLPGFARRGIALAVARRALRHVTVGLGYLPSWASPTIEVRIGQASNDQSLPPVVIGSRDNDATTPMLRDVIKRLTRSAGALDLVPIPTQTKLSGAAKSYHFGGSFPMSREATSPLSSDLLGRPGNWRNIHLVDASVFPSVPATTFTLTIMANAHRIATEVLAQP